MLTELGFFILIYCKERQRRGMLRSNSHDDLGNTSARESLGQTAVTVRLGAARTGKPSRYERVNICNIQHGVKMFFLCQPAYFILVWREAPRILIQKPPAAQETAVETAFRQTFKGRDELRQAELTQKKHFDPVLYVSHHVSLSEASLCVASLCSR